MTGIEVGIGVGIVSATGGIGYAVYRALRTNNKVKPGNGAECRARGVRLNHLEDRGKEFHSSQERIWTKLDDVGERTARIEGGIGEIKGLLKQGR